MPLPTPWDDHEMKHAQWKKTTTRSRKLISGDGSDAATGGGRIETAAGTAGTITRTVAEL